jgi:acetylornithine deacetylase/succinyl-diaminopimelate desuccinylase-like protein
MNRLSAIGRASAYFDDGRFRKILAARVAVHTESQETDSGPALYAYLDEQIIPTLAGLGFTCRVVENPAPGGDSPFLIAERLEQGAPFTVLTYGHGDVVRGYDKQWRQGLTPWTIVEEGDRWYGRGTADNKGQHSINFGALEQVLAERGGRLGYNVKVIFEMGEETGSLGLEEVCAANKQALAADVFIASDGPRLAAARPTMFLGSRGSFNFDLRIKLRDGAHHSGNWGGLLRNPAIRLANALATIADPRGRILVKGLLPTDLPANVREALKTIQVGGAAGDPEIDPDWGEPGLTPTERVFGWNSFEILAMKTGNPEAPVNAIPDRAYAHCQIRYVVGSDSANFVANIRKHLDEHGYDDIEVSFSEKRMEATRLNPDDAWVRWGLASMERTTGKPPALLPNLGGSLPNDIFAHVLGLPTLWVPHSYPACSQHAPDEHLLASVARESLQIMAGLFWDLAEEGPGIMRQRVRQA